MGFYMKQTSRLCGIAVLGVLLVLSGGASASPSGEKLDTETAPAASGGQRYLVKYRANTVEQRDVNAVAGGLRSAVTRAGLGRAVAARAGAPARTAASASLLYRSAAPGWNVVRTDRTLDSRESADFIRELKSNPAVESVEQDHLLQLDTVGDDQVMTPNDPDYAAYQWNFFSETAGVRAPQAWKLSQGSGVVVAVVDSGIVKGSPDLVELLPGYDMITDAEMSRRYTNGRAAGGWDLGDWIPAGENCNRFGENVPPFGSASSWHGSHVAGTIGQLTNNGNWLAGLAYKAKIVPVRVAGMCGGYTSDVADGIVWAAGGNVAGLPLNRNPADVINVSMGDSKKGPCPAVLQSALDIAAALGSIVVVSAGNASIPASERPYGNCKNVIAVGSSNSRGGLSDFSNYGPAVSLAAPGGQLLGSTVTDKVWQVTNAGINEPRAGQWQRSGKRGTSMAAPHVTAAVAMIQSAVHTPYTPAQMLKLLQETARPLQVPPSDEKRPSAGILDIEAALVKAVAVCEECVFVPIALTNKVVLSGIAGEQGRTTYYTFEAEAGKALSFMTYGGSGDVSMYVRAPGALVGDDGNTRSVRAGNIETVRYVTPVAGTYLIRLVGEPAYAGVSLVARQ